MYQFKIILDIVDIKSNDQIVPASLADTHANASRLVFIILFLFERCGMRSDIVNYV